MSDTKFAKGWAQLVKACAVDFERAITVHKSTSPSDGSGRVSGRLVVKPPRKPKTLVLKGPKKSEGIGGSVPGMRKVKGKLKLTVHGTRGRESHRERESDIESKREKEREEREAREEWFRDMARKGKRPIRFVIGGREKMEFKDALEELDGEAGSCDVETEEEERERMEAWLDGVEVDEKVKVRAFGRLISVVRK